MSYKTLLKGAQNPIEAAQRVRSRRARWGKLGAGDADEMETLVVQLLEQIEAYEGGLTKEEATKLRRQLAAANARAARASQQSDGE